jgi:hypothetical protein
VPPWQADGLVEDYAHYAQGEAEEVSPHVREVTGVDPRRGDIRRGLCKRLRPNLSGLLFRLSARRRGNSSHLPFATKGGAGAFDGTLDRAQ